MISGHFCGMAEMVTPVSDSYDHLDTFLIHYKGRLYEEQHRLGVR